jgi:hypothetical protein
MNYHIVVARPGRSAVHKRLAHTPGETLKRLNTQFTGISGTQQLPGSRTGIVLLIPAPQRGRTLARGAARRGHSAPPQTSKRRGIVRPLSLGRPNRDQMLFRFLPEGTTEQHLRSELTRHGRLSHVALSGRHAFASFSDNAAFERVMALPIFLISINGVQCPVKIDRVYREE